MQSRTKAAPVTNIRWMHSVISTQFNQESNKMQILCVNQQYRTYFYTITGRKLLSNNHHHNYNNLISSDIVSSFSSVQRPCEQILECGHKPPNLEVPWVHLTQCHWLRHISCTWDVDWSSCMTLLQTANKPWSYSNSSMDTIWCW